MGSWFSDRLRLNFEAFAWRDIYMARARELYFLKFSYLTDVSADFRPPCWCPSRWAPTWRLHTNLYKFGANVSPHIFHKKNCCDLNLSESLCISTFFLFPDSGLNLLDGFYFYFDLFLMAWHWKLAIIKIWLSLCPIHVGCVWFMSIEWSQRAFASMQAVRLILQARAVINFLMRAASTLEITNGEQWALSKFSAISGISLY